tara:strand:- start:377 stop:631 length:255 start_codon:yes stop_codon:yes gene_type:complete
MKSIKWKITILHPVSEDIIEESFFDNITEIAEKYKRIPISTWRNIALGRSKIYSKFIVCEKIRLPIKNENPENKSDPPIVLTFE